MGPLNHGSPMDWKSTCLHKEKAKMDGIDQFLNVYHFAKNFKEHQLKWGDEVEYTLLKLEPSLRKVKLSLAAHRIMDELQREENSQTTSTSLPMLWRTEFANWMVEGTPGVPYRYYVADLVNVEKNMMLRRKRLYDLLDENELVMTLTAFPRFGCGIFTSPPTQIYEQRTKSYLVSDEVCFPHPKFSTIIHHVRLRRGENVRIQVPLFLDARTVQLQPLIPNDNVHRALLKNSEETPILQSDCQDPFYMCLDEALKTEVKKSILLDSSIFGPGCCCLQVTIQGRDIEESRYLYDQLAVLAPFMLALTAATPAIRGMLLETDTRWNILCASMDDRSSFEISSGTIPKSRYSSIDCFLSNRIQSKPHLYHDLPIPIHEEAYNRLISEGVDHLLAQHVAHLFVRDPLLLYPKAFEQDNTMSTDQFENIQSTNWNTVRFKPPPLGSDIGWRTEFRPMEVGLTDFENAAMSVFVVILSRVILAFNLDLYMSMSKLEKNMSSASRRDAVRSELFFFKRNIFSLPNELFSCECGHVHDAVIPNGKKRGVQPDRLFQKESNSNLRSSFNSDSYAQMTLNEIFNGSLSVSGKPKNGFDFPGLIPLMRGYVSALKVDDATRNKVLRYIDFVSDRASGKLCTVASYIRQFIQSHKLYKSDSVVSEEICHDLIDHLRGITNGTVQAPQLLGNYYQESLSTEVESPLSMVELMQKKWEGEQAGSLDGAAMPESVFWDTTAYIEKYIHDQCYYDNTGQDGQNI